MSNVLLHAAAAAILFLVLRSMTGRLWPSALVAALFAIHPLRVESVAWVAGRKDVLSGLFFMLALGAYVQYVRHSFSLARYAAVVGTFALGLMSKPIMMTLPAVLLLLDGWPLGRMTSGGDGLPFRDPSEAFLRWLPMRRKRGTVRRGRYDSCHRRREQSAVAARRPGPGEDSALGAGRRLRLAVHDVRKDDRNRVSRRPRAHRVADSQRPGCLSDLPGADRLSRASDPFVSSPGSQPSALENRRRRRAVVRHLRWGIGILAAMSVFAHRLAVVRRNVGAG